VSRVWIVFHPRYERFLRRCGVVSPEAALDLPGEVVCGHPDRHVARVELGAGRVVYLKREHAVGVRVRLRNARAGFGWVSRCEREAATLQRLEAAGLPGPQWLAYGADGAGRAFLIVDELPAVELRAFLSDTGVSAFDRRQLAERAGRAVADLHDAGFGTPELAAKHLFVDPASLAVTLLDWQSSGPLADADRPRQLAGLHATLSADLAGPRLRLRFLRAYLGGRKAAGMARAVMAHADRIRDRSSVRDQRRPAPAQRLVWLAGEAVCVVPELVPDWPTPPTAAPFYDAPPGEEWVTFPDGRRALLVRYRTVDPLGRLAAVLREKPWRSPAARAARVLFHLERHGVPGPKLLAFGQRLTGPAAAESFVLYEPPTALPLPNLRECGRVLRTLHDAGCRLTARPDSPMLRIDSPDAVALTRRPDRIGDLRATCAGLSRTDRARVVRGYTGSDPTAFRPTLARLR
jgi:tRNA A-37 threonylcarbamoyl transferase component Bud32